MKQFQITDADAGQRFDKYLGRILKDATNGFLYKMLRKKNITLNDQKADGRELIKSGDVVKIWLSDETYEKFAGITAKVTEYDFQPDVVYEDEHVLIVNKPVGILSQKAEDSDVSMNEYCLSYLFKSGAYEPGPGVYKPSVCNRLDRNTTGMLLVAKSLPAARELSELLKNRTLQKYYLCVVKGVLSEAKDLKGYLIKDNKTNKVSVRTGTSEVSDEEAYIETGYEPVTNNGRLTLLKVHLITGKTHQIRAHLSSIHHPILGDYKYGDRKLNEEYGVKYQLLHAFRICFPELTGSLANLSNREIEIPMPSLFDEVMRK